MRYIIYIYKILNILSISLVFNLSVAQAANNNQTPKFAATQTDNPVGANIIQDIPIPSIQTISNPPAPSFPPSKPGQMKAGQLNPVQIKPTPSRANQTQPDPIKPGHKPSYVSPQATRPDQPIAAPIQAGKIQPAPLNTAKNSGRASNSRLLEQALNAYQTGAFKTALELATPLAKGNNTTAQNILGDIFSSSNLNNADYQKAAYWYQLSAANNSNYGRYKLAILLYDGNGVPQDREKAIELFKALAADGNLDAQYRYAQILKNKALKAKAAEQKELKDQALAWLLKCASKGSTNCSYTISKLITSNKDSSDHEKALAKQFLEIAAKSGNDLASIELTQNLLAATNQGVSVSKQTASQDSYKQLYPLIRRAAYHGYGKAQLLLAQLYQSGLGVSKDTMQAATWYIIAKQKGFTDITLDKITNNLTDIQRQDIIKRINGLLLPG